MLTQQIVERRGQRHFFGIDARQRAVTSGVIAVEICPGQSLNHRQSVFESIERLENLWPNAIGQHYSTPWLKPLSNRLYLHRGVSDGIPKFEDVTELAELPSLLLKNETKGDCWLDVAVANAKGVNAMGVGSRVDIYEAEQSGNSNIRVGSLAIATGFGYASSQESVAHFGLADRTLRDVVVTLPHGKGRIVRNGVQVSQRITVTP